MGAWATDSFSNDDAMDWLDAFTEAPTLEMLRDTLEAVVSSDAEDLEAPDCWDALAAAEIVAALSGRPAPCMPEDLKAWLETAHGLSATSLSELAHRVVERIRSASEVQELWDGSEFRDTWHDEMKHLLARLSQGTVSGAPT